MLTAIFECDYCGNTITEHEYPVEKMKPDVMRECPECDNVAVICIYAPTHILTPSILPGQAAVRFSCADCLHAENVDVEDVEHARSIIRREEPAECSECGGQIHAIGWIKK
jgi:NAD-dependent SIR2 family protein deacetylase